MQMKTAERTLLAHQNDCNQKEEVPSTGGKVEKLESSYITGNVKNAATLNISLAVPLKVKHACRQPGWLCQLGEQLLLSDQIVVLGS